MIRIIVLLLIISLTGCSLFRQEQPEVRIRVVPVPMTVYQPEPVEPVRLENIQWHVITENNLEEKMAEIKKQLGTGFVVFAMTPQSYENLSYNVQELRRYIREQASIILYYEGVTEPNEMPLEPEPE